MSLWRGLSWIPLKNILCGSREPGGPWFVKAADPLTWGLGLMAQGILWTQSSNSNSDLK